VSSPVGDKKAAASCTSNPVMCWTSAKQSPPTFASKQQNESARRRDNDDTFVFIAASGTIAAHLVGAFFQRQLQQVGGVFNRYPALVALKSMNMSSLLSRNNCPQS
jgi:hypothetical protein